MTNVEHFLNLTAVRRTGSHVAHGLFVETVDRDAGRLLNPALELCSALGIFQASEVFRGVKQPSLYNLIDLNRTSSEYGVAADAAVVDMLIDDPKVLLAGNDGKLLEPFADSALGLDVLPVILDIERPALRIMPRKIPRAAAVDFRGLTGDREVTDQRLARFRLLLVLG